MRVWAIGEAYVRCYFRPIQDESAVISSNLFVCLNMYENHETLCTYTQGGKTENTNFMGSLAEDQIQRLVKVH